MLNRKISVCLQGANIINWGIMVYLNEIVLRLAKYDDLDLNGIVLWERALHSCYDLAAYSRFKFPIKVIPMPGGVMFGTGDWKRELMGNILRPFLRNYNFWAGESDVYLFLGSRAPIIPIKGKVISCLHDILPVSTPMAYTPWEIEFSKKVFSNVVEKSTRIITVSEFSKKEIIKYFNVPEERIDIVYNGVETESFKRISPERERIRAVYGLPDKYILYFGACRPYKNVESIIKAYAGLSEATRREYGLVISNPTDAIKTCADENDVNVCYIEKVSNEDRAAIYQMASVFVWPSLCEGFGIPIIEAMAAGVPVVCSNATSIPEVAGDAAVLVEPMDINAITNGIERCIYDEQFRNGLIAKGYENIKRFSWDDSAKKLHDIIMSV